MSRLIWSNMATLHLQAPVSPHLRVPRRRPQRRHHDLRRVPSLVRQAADGGLDRSSWISARSSSRWPTASSVAALEAAMVGPQP